MFETHDPDPYAIDGGRVIGVRIEIFDRSKLKKAHTPLHFGFSYVPAY